MKEETLDKRGDGSLKWPLIYSTQKFKFNLKKKSQDFFSFVHLLNFLRLADLLHDHGYKVKKVERERGVFRRFPPTHTVSLCLSV